MAPSLKALAVALALLTPLPGYAQTVFYTGQGFLDLSRDSGTNGTIQAIGYVQGVRDAVARIGSICVPGTVTSGQMLAVTQKYLDDNPKYWNEPASTSIVLALYEAWPCAPPKRAKPGNTS